ncbi:hypothetical protein [Paenibacillus sp. OV219]|uniref:hypothetical protein n=1 Tax=Paenibacillus sp. OV219 TaxID=1884377 RepID=UPI0008CFF1C4|nr:hypothetical protein [Paenibacillus sp. OV219]SEM50628.1 hypothetical protein SAMN05518847_10117 [Paenibacillus sp. OV219]
MNEFISIANIQEVFDKVRKIPSILMWNRLEGRPRTLKFDRALRAEVRDPLFLLTKQWQMGEFQGDDAGSPVITKVHMETTRFQKYKANSHPAQKFESNIPFETKVEHRTLPFKAGDQELSLDIRLLMGRQWLKMADSPELHGLKKVFIQAYSIKQPDPAKPEDAHICAHLGVWQRYASVAGRAMDGAALYTYVKASISHHAYDKFPTPDRQALTQMQMTLIESLETRFTAWFEKLFSQPAEENQDAWLPSKLEYQFSCSAPSNGEEKVYSAEEYYHGNLDWYNLNSNRAVRSLGEADGSDTAAALESALTQSFFASQIKFDGMPNTRWWAFEEGKTNFGDIKPDKTDLNKLLLMEFGLVYSNDWFLVPVTVGTGCIANVKGMTVDNVFGERIWVQPAGAGNDQDWQRWSMFALSVEGNNLNGSVDLSLMVLPTVPKIQESEPVEDVYLVRDEMANMVWGIENKILLPNGDSKSGREAALELHNYYQRLLGGATAGGSDAKADIKYELMSTMPENWIPFIPVHVPGNNREIQLQRAAIPRILEGNASKPDKVRPRTTLLSVGLDQQPKIAYLLFEEEVPRSGVRVYQSYQRTRWHDGRVYNWLGIRKQTGRGESLSNLRFDVLADTKK